MTRETKTPSPSDFAAYCEWRWTAVAMGILFPGPRKKPRRDEWSTWSDDDMTFINEQPER